MKPASLAAGVIVILAVPVAKGSLLARRGSSPLVVDGYTDCQKQNPTGKEWWETAALGHRAPGFHRAEVYPVPRRGAAVCAPPKNGCTYWKALLMRMNDNPRWNHPAPRARHTNNGLKTSWDPFHRKAGMTFMLVRNPLVRILSAFLDKKNDVTGHFSYMLAPYPLTKEGFERFVDAFAPSIQSHHANPHWIRQSDLCGLPLSASYDFYLKVECRGLWGPSLIDKLDLHEWTDSGWGSDGKQPFIPPSNSTGAATPTDIHGYQANDEGGSHSHRADKVSKVCEWYSAELFQKAASLYAEDIKAFGYAEDVQRLEKACGF